MNYKQSINFNINKNVYLSGYSSFIFERSKVPIPDPVPPPRE